MSADIEKLAAEILHDEAWFKELDPSMKDHLSQPNHNASQAEKGIRLAKLVESSRWLSGPECNEAVPTRTEAEVPDDAAQVDTRTACERWQAQHKNDAPDRPKIHVWYPRDTPWSRLHVIESGRDTLLPKGDLMAYLTVAGVEIGGRLDDLELLVAVCAEELAETRRYAEELQAGGGAP